MILKKIKNFILNPKLLLFYMDLNGLIRIDDAEFLKIRYEKAFNKELDLNNPKTFNEKLQWLKLYDRKDIYTTMVDKYEAKKYVANIIGKEYIIPTLGIYDSFDDIDFNKLPNRFVIKCTHDSGGLVIVKDKSKLDIKKAKHKINKCLKKNYYYQCREWPYKNVKPRILIEEFKEDNKLKELIDYKLYCFNGKAYYVMTCIDRMKGETKFIYYDKNWNLIKEFSNDGMKYGDSIDIPRPKNLEKMFKIAKILSKDIPFIRVDFYEANEELYFGELTFYPSGGFDNKRTEAVEKFLNENLDINMKMKESR